MTAVLDRHAPAAWSTMPGWGIVVDLTPPEVVKARSLRLIRRFIAVGLLIVLVCCALGYLYALNQSSSASDEANAASEQTTQLQIETNKYGGVNKIESDVAGIRSQVASVMGTDVDYSALLDKIRSAAPSTMSIQSLMVTVSPATITDSSSLDVSGVPHIGSVTVNGVARQLTDLPAYVDRLSSVRGIVNVLPTTNEVSSNKVQFAVSFDINDTLYSHRYDATTNGGK
jgi:Tfp pilus assembly protein PilN